jgi:flavin reductase (DIM6/NTAB) family NADH-FMN oxidoreductase RutF
MEQQGYIFVDGDSLNTETAYRLLVGCVAPCPVAWITTVDEQGRVNEAPFSSYNYVATGPPMLAINTATRAGSGDTKDTARNIVRSRANSTMHRPAREALPIWALSLAWQVGQLRHAGAPWRMHRTCAGPATPISVLFTAYPLIDPPASCT